jgi:hypothetical protein
VEKQLSVEGEWKSNYPLKVCGEDSYISDLNIFNIFLLLYPWSGLVSEVCVLWCLGLCGLSLGQSCLCLCVESGSVMSVCDRGGDRIGLHCRQLDHTLEQTSSREGQLRCSTKSLLQTTTAGM